MKGDANMKVPREAWERAKAYAEKHGRKIRDVMSDAVDVFIAQEEFCATTKEAAAVAEVTVLKERVRSGSFFPEPLSR